MVSVLFNAALTFVLVARFRFGISGAAWGTVLSQLLSASHCIAHIVKKTPFMAVRREDMRYNGALIRRAAHYAAVSALQQSSLYIGKLFVQGTVNVLGRANIAGAFGDSGAEAVSIFTAHRTGAGNCATAQRIFIVGLALMSAFGVVSCTAMYLLAVPSVSFFLGSGDFSIEATTEGVAYLRIMSPCYLFAFVANTFVGYFRGSGRVNVLFPLTTLQITLRVISAFMLVHRFGLGGVALATGIGWGAMVVCQFGIYRIVRLKPAALLSEGMRK